MNTKQNVAFIELFGELKWNVCTKFCLLWNLYDPSLNCAERQTRKGNNLLYFVAIKTTLATFHAALEKSSILSKMSGLRGQGLETLHFPVLRATGKTTSI